MEIISLKSNARKPLTKQKVFYAKATASWNVVHRHFLVLMWVCGARQLLIIDYIFIFHILRRNEAVNSKLRSNYIFSWTFEPSEKKKYHSVTTCSCARIIHYTTSTLVKIMHLSQLFFHMLTLKALRKLTVTDLYGNDLNVSMNQYQ